VFNVSTNTSGRQFTGQKTQPTVSSTEGEDATKVNPEKADNTKYSNTIKTHTKNTLVYNNM